MDILIRANAGTQAKAVTKKSETKKTGKANFKDSIQDSINVQEEQATQQTSAPQTIDALFLCLNGRSKGASKQVLDQGHSILDRLNGIRLGLLQGSISQQTLHELKTLLSLDVGALKDATPELQDLIREIQIRAAVELAKLEKNV